MTRFLLISFGFAAFNLPFSPLYASDITGNANEAVQIDMKRLGVTEKFLTGTASIATSPKKIEAICSIANKMASYLPGDSSIDATMQTYADDLEEGKFADFQRKEAREAIRMLGLAAGDFRLRLGDLYLKHGCLAEADAYYRFVVEHFGGDRFSGLRERALVGIDDVRDLRNDQ